MILFLTTIFFSFPFFPQYWALEWEFCPFTHTASPFAFLFVFQIGSPVNFAWSALEAQSSCLLSCWDYRSESPTLAFLYYYKIVGFIVMFQHMYTMYFGHTDPHHPHVFPISYWPSRSKSFMVFASFFLNFHI
jgi:hypothetical protein